MASKVSKLNEDMHLEDPVAVLEEAKGRDLETVLILGYNSEGYMVIRSNASLTRRDALWLMELAKLDLFGVENENA